MEDSGLRGHGIALRAFGVLLASTNCIPSSGLVLAHCFFLRRMIIGHSTLMTNHLLNIKKHMVYEND